MNKLFRILLALHIALYQFIPDLAQAANRFLTCATTCTITAADTSIWGTASGGTGASVPGSGDDVIMDGGTCVGTTTCTATFGSGYNPTWRSITWGACTASTTGCILDASVNNNSFTLTGGTGVIFSGTGIGTRKWLSGTGTYAITSTNANGCFSMATTTNDQGSVFSGATWTCSGATTSGRTWAGGGFSFGPTTFNANSSGGSTFISGVNTFASLTFGAPNYIIFPSGTTTVSGALTVSGGTSTSLVALLATSVDTPITLSLGSASSGSWTTWRAITTSGAAAFTGTNCLDLGRNTFANGGACNAPTPGGGSTPKTIGG